MVPTVAEAYGRYIGRYSEQLAPVFVATIGVAEGQKVLEVGCGPGALTSALVAAAGPGRVWAVDPSEQYVEACRARAQGADVRVGRAETLPFPDGAFDVAVAQLVVNLLEDPEAGVREMRRVTRSGGAVAAAVWAPDGMPLLRSFWDSALAVAPGAVAAVGEDGRVGFGKERLGELWERCGLTDLALSAVAATVTYRDFDELWAPLEAGVGRSGALCAALDPVRRQSLRAELYGRLGSPPSAFPLTARAWCVRGTVP